MYAGNIPFLTLKIFFLDLLQFLSCGSMPKSRNQYGFVAPCLTGTGTFLIQASV